MNNKSLKPGICKASDGTEISPISSAKTAYVDNGETVYDALKDINITIESTAKIEVLEDFEDTDIDVDTGELNEKLDQTLDKLDDIDYNITNNTNVKLTELEKKIDNINSDIGETFDLEGSNNSGSVNAKLNKVINDNISLQESINTANKNIGSKIDVIGSTTEGTIYGKLNSIISSIKKLSDEDIESIKTLLGNYDDESLNTVFSKLNEILDVSNVVKNTIGITSDTGATSSSGTVNGKLNKIITTITTLLENWTSEISEKIDNIHTDVKNSDEVNSIGTISQKLNYLKQLVGTSGDLKSSSTIFGKLVEIKELISSNTTSKSGTQTFLSDGTFTVPSGVTKILVTACAGGGAGGNTYYSSEGGSTYGAGAGGGGGEVIYKYPFNVTPKQTIQITIGKGGIVDSTDGGNTIIGSLKTLKGGKSANIMTPGEAGGDGAGQGGFAGSSDTYNNYSSGTSTSGQGGFFSAGGISRGGNFGAGGGGSLGNGGSGSISVTEKGTTPGYGGGGGGGYRARSNKASSGTNGGNGIVIIEW